MSERASIFDDDLDLSAFDARPKPKPDKESLRAVAEARGFPSREAVAVPAAPEPVLQRRYRTGRNRQLNLKVTDEALRRFYAVADAQGLVLGQVFEQAVEALEEKLKAEGGI